MSLSPGSNHKSIAYVYVSQGAAALFPLLVAPFIVRNMGLEVFGIYAVLLMCAHGAGTVSEYSFDAVGPRILASCDDVAGDRIYWQVLGNKLVLFPFAVLVGASAALVLSGPHFDWVALAAVCFHVAGVAIHSPWFLIATGQTRVLAISTLVGRTVALVAVAVAVYHGAASPSILLLATSSGMLTGALLAFSINSAINVRLRVPIPQVNLLPSGSKAFVGVAGAFLQNFLGQAIALWSGGAVGAGVYAAVDRLARAVSAALKPLFSVAYPRLVKLHRENHKRAWNVLNRAAFVWIGFSVVLLFFASIFSNHILSVFYGEEMSEHGSLLLIIVAWLCVGVLNNIYGIQGILASGMDSVFARAMWMGIATTLIAALLLGDALFGAWLAATAVLIGESAILMHYLLAVLRQGRHEHTP